MKQNNFDTIIIGGGMVGMAMAAALAPTQRVALVDASPLIKKDDHRLIALNYNSFCLFKNLNLWHSLAPHATAIEKLHVSQHGRFGVTRIHHDECDLPVLGYVVPAQHIESALHAAISNLNNVTLYRPAVLDAFSKHEQIITANITRDGASSALSADLLIGADGTHSSVRRLAGIKTETTDYQQTAIVTVTELRRSHLHTAYERFHGNGAIAMLPLPGNFAATIWTEDNAKTEHLMRLSDAEFLRTLQTEFGYRLGRLVGVSHRHTYPLQMQTALQDFSDNVILIGNAAHTLHPVAAQGLNLALAEIAMLSQHIANAQAWHEYQTWQQQQVTSSLRLSHHLLQIFARDFAPLAWIRQTGLLALDIFPALKRRFTQKALGRHLTLPPLLIDAELE